MTPPGLTLHTECVSKASYPPRIQPGDGGQGCSWQGSWCPRDLKFETWHLQGLLYLQNVCQGHPVLQGSNLEMVDRGVFDRVPDVLETWFSKHDTSRAYPNYRMCVKGILFSKDPTWRWLIGVFLTEFLMSQRLEIHLSSEWEVSEYRTQAWQFLEYSGMFYGICSRII